MKGLVEGYPTTQGVSLGLVPLSGDSHGGGRMVRGGGTGGGIFFNPIRVGVSIGLGQVVFLIRVRAQGKLRHGERLAHGS
jgi:hypothetical protein